MDFDDEDLTTFDDNPRRPKTSGRERENYGGTRPGTRFLFYIETFFHTFNQNI